MKPPVAACVACALFVAAGPAGAQPAQPAPSPTLPQERPAATGESGLNLKLDGDAAPRPRIDFGPQTPAAGRGESNAADSLPSLGETPGKAPGFPGGSSRGMGMRDPIPKDTNPGIR